MNIKSTSTVSVHLTAFQKWRKKRQKINWYYEFEIKYVKCMKRQNVCVVVKKMGLIILLLSVTEAPEALSVGTRWIWGELWRRFDLAEL